MNYITVHQQFGHLGLFSTQEVIKRFPTFDARRLVEWQQKGYIQRVANRWYLFRETPVDETLLWWTANRLYQPSYLSLETALSFYGLIPEGVYALTSVSSRKTQTFQTPLASFAYRHLKPTCYFGYQVVRPPTGSGPDRPVLMAYLEKALLDFCYLNPHLATVDDFAAMRLNASLLRTQLDHRRLQTYLNLFGVQQLTHRITVLHQYIDHYA
jgi:predicted transcriptional regulator of viral defense system